MRDLKKPLSELQRYVAHAYRVNKGVSAVNVGWHIEHSILVMTKSVSALCKSDPADYKWQFNHLRTLVFLLNRFPRGKGKAPDEVMPKQAVGTDFNALFEKGEAALTKLDSADPRQFFVHSLLGKLDRRNTAILLDIHTRHHLRIIRDIVSSK